MADARPRASVAVVQPPPAAAIRHRAADRRTVADRRTAAGRTAAAVGMDMGGNTALDSFPA